MTLAHNSDLFFFPTMNFMFVEEIFLQSSLTYVSTWSHLKIKDLKQNIGRLNRLRWLKRVISNFLKTNTTAEAGVSFEGWSSQKQPALQVHWT